MADQQQWIIGLEPGRAGAGRASEQGAADRPPSLEGAVVGLVSNQKSRATDFLQKVYDELALSHGVVGQVLVTKATVSSAPTDDDWNRLRSEASVAIAGYGG